MKNFEINVMGDVVRINIVEGNITEKEEFLRTHISEKADPVKAWENKKNSIVLAIKQRSTDGLVFNVFIDNSKIVSEDGGSDFLRLSISDNIAIELLKEYYIEKYYIEKENLKLEDLFEHYDCGATYHDVKIAIQVELLSKM